MSSILIGCDPEVFVKQGGVFKSAWNLIKGDKANPQRVEKGAVQVDGMALEFNIDPAASADEFVVNCRTVLDQMIAMVPDYEVVATPVADFTMDYIKAQPDEAKELGCTPDYCAWTELENVKPDGERPMRTASGHIHIGWTDKEDPQDPVHRAKSNAVAKEMDFRLGLVSLLVDDNVRRREMYGKAGCVRYKPYGVEYRTLSNFWLNSPDLMRWVFQATIQGMEEVMAGRFLVDKYGDIQEIINNSDVKKAHAIIAEAKLMLPKGVKL